MNCTACTYCNDYNQTSCIICNTALIGEADERKTESSFKKWLTDRGLASISSKVDESIVEESTELPNILDTSSKTTRKQAIKLAYEIGLYKGEKKGIVPEPNSKKEKILEDRMIRQEQDLKSEILIDKKYFCVSSDKATNPVNFMGASKRIMEIFLTSKS